MTSFRSDDIYELPADLPIPEDDGACTHLINQHLPSIALSATDGAVVDLSTLKAPVLIFCYPRTGRPDVASPHGWNAIAGARGCTPQTCGFRDIYAEFKNLNVAVFGLSTQTTEYQQELATRLNLPFQVLSDYSMKFVQALSLPTFQIEDMVLVKRLTIIANSSGLIRKVFYPVFPPTTSASESLDWIKNNYTTLVWV